VYATFSDVDFKNQGDATVNLVPDAQVLRVSGGGGTTEAASTNDIMVTLGLTPRDGQRVVFAQEKGSVWLALLPPGLKGKPLPPVTYAQAFIHSAGPKLGGQ
jgi:hypothetical protein